MMEKMIKTVLKIEAVVGRAGNEGSSGRVYVPREWIGKKVEVKLVNNAVDN